MSLFRMIRATIVLGLYVSFMTPMHEALAQVRFELPLGIGLRMPSYDRVNGASVPVGPRIVVGTEERERLVIDPTVTYRSHLGDFDPRLTVRWNIVDTTLALTLDGFRGTLTHESWIRSTLVNSFTSLLTGRDARNYYRTDKFEARVGYTPFASEERTLKLYASTGYENDWATGWRPGERNGPFAFIYPHDESNGILRPNPSLSNMEMVFGMIGASFARKGDRLEAGIGADIELGSPHNTSFVQVTSDAALRAPTIYGQRLELRGHLLSTTGDPTPGQRFGYLGGSGTLATENLLSLGGDRLYYGDLLYLVPLTFIDLPVIGAPFIAPHVSAGAAGIRRFGLPTFNLGARAGAGPVGVDVMVNPRTHEKAVGLDFSFGIPGL
jgi:hypothetical protein